MDGPTQTSLGDSTSAETVALPPKSAPQPSRPVLTQTSIPDEGRFVAGTLLAGRYRIVGLLGKGGMGEVYRATDLALGQAVALKFLPPAAADNPQLLERFHGEVRVARQVSHPNVCRVYDIGESDGLPFISMEYVDGEDLSSLLLRIGRLPADKAIDTARRICAGLAAAHSKGVIHRDLKPQNIMMNRRGEIVIMDFGLAAIADQLSGPEARNGTPAYMSPEQLKGTEVTPRSDIYALGLVLYELFTGRKPYEAKTVRQLIALQESAQVTSMSSVAADVDPVVDRVIRRCLDPDPAKRPESALKVAAALPGGDPLEAALAAGETPSPELVASSGETAGMAPRRALVCLAVVILSLCVAPWLKQQKIAFYRAPLDYPPEVLRQKARETAAALGHTRKPADSEVKLFQQLELLTYLDLRPEPRKWREWMAAEAPVRAAYRESLSPMVALPFGQTSDSNPPLVQPGMVAMDLDGAGRLRSFTGVPYDHPEPGPGPVAVEAVFRAAQLDPATFTETNPGTQPITATDQLRAWKGPHPGIKGMDLTVEIGTWKGQLTHMRIIWPWMAAANRPVQHPIMLQIRAFLDPFLGITGIVLGIIFARRNWKLQRGDRRGAFAVGIAQMCLQLVASGGSIHPVVDGSMVDILSAVVGDACFAGTGLLLLYLAAEPAVRARWPHAVITWNRLLAGRFGDAQVASHILIGAVVGSLLWVTDEARLVLSISKSGLDTMGGLYLLYGPRQWVAGNVGHVSEALKSGLVVFGTLFALRTLLKRDWIAALAAAIVFTFLEGGLANSIDLATEMAVTTAAYTLLMFTLLRFGLVATISAVFFVNTISGITLGTDPTTWYAPTGFATIGLVLVLTLFAFKQALGPNGLFGPDEEQA